MHYIIMATVPTGQVVVKTTERETLTYITSVYYHFKGCTVILPDREGSVSLSPSVALSSMPSKSSVHNAYKHCTLPAKRQDHGSTILIFSEYFVTQLQ